MNKFVKLNKEHPTGAEFICDWCGRLFKGKGLDGFGNTDEVLNNTHKC